MAAKYETIVVFKPDLTESQIKEEEKKIENLLKSEGGSSITVEPWGRKDIAYLVQKCKTGNYVCFRYESTKSDTVKNLTGVLRIADAVIKFQTHRHSDRVRKFKGNPRRQVSGDQADDFIDGGEEAY